MDKFVLHDGTGMSQKWHIWLLFVNYPSKQPFWFLAFSPDIQRPDIHGTGHLAGALIV